MCVMSMDILDAESVHLLDMESGDLLDTESNGFCTPTSGDLISRGCVFSAGVWIGLGAVSAVDSASCLQRG